MVVNIVPEPDGPLTADEEARVAALTEDKLREIDSLLLANCRERWRKIAMVAGTTMLELRDRYPDLPDRFYAQRVRRLVENGLLEAQGQLEYMGFSEVRLITAVDESGNA